MQKTYSSFLLSLIFLIIFQFVTFQGKAQFFAVDHPFVNHFYDVQFVNENVVYACGSNGIIIKSEDAGISWDSLPNPATNDLYSCFFFDENKGVVVGEEGVYFSTIDGGHNWQLNNSFEGSLRINNIQFVDSLTGYLLLTDRIFKSFDGGNTWNEIYNAGLHVFGDMYFKGEVGLVVDGQLKTLVTHNGGETWIAGNGTFGEGAIYTIPVWIFNENQMLTGADWDYVFKSEDGGKNWVGNQYGSGYNYFLNVYFKDDFHGFLAGLVWNTSRDNAASVILETYDGGRTWNAMQSDRFGIHRIKFNNSGVGLAVGRSGTILRFTENYSTITGLVFQDLNNNCIQDKGEEGISGVLLKAEPGGYYATTDSSGNYQVHVNELGEYTVTELLETHKYLSPGCKGISQSTLITGYNQLSVADFPTSVLQCTQIETTISSSRRRRCFTSVTTVNYSNIGSVKAENVLLNVTYPEYVVPLSSTIPWNEQTDSVFTWQIPVIKPGETGSIRIIDSVVCGIEDIRGLTQCTKAVISPAGTCNSDFVAPNPMWDKSSIKVSGSCENGVVTMRIKNCGDGDMSGMHEYRVFINDTLVARENFQLESGHSLVLEILAEGKTVRLEADQHILHPGRSRPRETIEGCTGGSLADVSKGFVVTSAQDDLDEFIDIDCMPITDSYDPNDKQVSPAGVNVNHYIYDHDQLEYLIRFQNTGTDTAYTVIVVDTLSEYLQPESIQILGSSHPMEWTLSGSVNPVLIFFFSNIDLPDSTTNNSGSNGFVKFLISQQSGNQLGTVIQNEADIYFDFNSPIITNTTQNEIWDGWLEDFSEGYRVLGSTLVTSTILASSHEIKAKPNPFSESIYISIKEMGNYQIILAGVDGKVYFDQQVTLKDYVLNSDFLLPGIYFLRLISEDGNVHVMKLQKK